MIDKNENKTFHPSLDIKDNILVLGFRIKNEEDRESDVFVVKTNESLYITDKTEFELDDESYSIDKKKRILSKLSQKWNLEELKSFITYYNEPTNSKPNGKILYQEIKASLEKYIGLEDVSDYSILTAWIIGTYFFPIFSAYPYIHIKAPKGSGKSQCLNFIQQTAFNAVKARASLPALRDTVDALRGTYLMDQADALHRNNMEDILDILTDSYKRGGGGVRKMIATKNAWVLEEFEAYSPKGFASINQLPEDLRDRCIVIPLVRSNKNYPSLNEEDSIWKELRGNIYKILICYFKFIIQNYTIIRLEYKTSNEITGRPLELWLPIESVMKSLGLEENEIDLSKMRFLSRYEFAGYQTSEIEVAVIQAIISLMKDKTEAVFRPKEIALGIDSELFNESDKFNYASQKQKSTIVGRIISKFNLADKKLIRDSQGERYLFSKEQIKKIYDGYFVSKSEEQDTQTYTEEKTLETKELFNENQNVTQ